MKAKRQHHQHRHHHLHCHCHSHSHSHSQHQRQKQKLKMLIATATEATMEIHENKRTKPNDLKTTQGGRWALLRNRTPATNTNTRGKHPIKIIWRSSVPLVLALLTMAVTTTDASNYFDTQGPNFSHEPHSRIEFTNTAGCIADCIAHGNPPPNVEWLDKDNNPITSISKVRHILANGSLYFPPFEAEEFRQDVHWSVYHCVASNAVGSIVSRDVVVKAVVNQRYEPEVQNPGGFIGSNVLIKCNIPSFVKEYVTVTSWLQEPNFNIYPSLEGDGKNHMLPTGELLVYNITRTDAHKIYRCRTHHKLTQDSVVSSNVGKIQLTEMRELVPPIMNEKSVSISYRLGDPVVVPCVAYANPKPVYRWHTKRPNNEESIQHLLATGRAKIKDGTLIITAVEKSDNGAFYCTATNSEGSETLEVQLSITSPLTTNIQPTVQTVNLGKTADLICSISGFPKQSITWLKDGQPLRSGSRVRLLSKEHIRITSITKEDKGMYQCLVKNDLESVQGTAELRLGEVAPQLIYKFIEQTIQPGPSISLKCSASGNPTPKIVWHLDGFPLPNNDRLMIGQYVTMFGDVISHVNISAVKSEDGGEYECKAISRAGEASHSARLNIYGMPYVRPMPKLSAVAGKTFFLKCPVAGYPIDTIIIEKEPPKITPFSFAIDLNVGDRTSIQCVIGTGDLPLTFTWLKDGQPLQVISSKSSPSTAVVAPSPIGGASVSGGLSGTVDVAAINGGGGGGGIGATSTVTGHHHGNGNGNGNGGHGGHSGHLMMSPGTLLSNDDGSSGGVGGGGLVTIRQNDDFTSALSITSVTRAQSGTYTCRVQNDAATVSHSAQLRVNVPPRISPFNFEDEITEGMRTQLMCSSSQGDQPFNITWLKDGNPILSGPISGPGALSQTNAPIGMGLDDKHYLPPDPSLTINEYAPFSSIISIQNVTTRHNGNYTCRVTNRAGSVEYTTVLSVSVPPRWILKPTDQDAILGNPVVITCKADGFPVPTVQWKQSIGDSGDYRELSYGHGNGNSQSVIETYNNGSLIIPKVGREHEGSYLCQASNGIGAGLSTLIKLTVHVGPSVTVSKKQVTVRRGDRVTLRCEADGDQPLDISWRAKANRIDPSYDIRYHIKDSPLSRGVVSEMSILQTILSDRGEYSCIASNTYGHDRAVIHLQVQEPPNFPVNLHVTDLGSRSVTLAWSPNDQDSILLGNGGANNRDSQPISNYILQYKKAGDVWHEHNNQKLLPGEKTTAQIGALRPAQAYHFRLYAENHLGTSAPSDILLVQTDAEVPSGRPQDVSAEPLGPQQLLITWRPPERDTWNGDLLGYTIAYQKHGSTENVQNFTKVSSLGGEGLNDFRLTGLEKYTQYSITVSAFNVKGDGPPSEVSLGHTLEDVPSAPPQGVTCIALTAQNIQISWQAPPKESNHGIIQGYKLLYEPGNIESEYGTRETKITSALSTVLHGLQPFTNYSVQVLAFTRAGEGVVSATVSCTTEEAVPDAPERVKSVVSSESSVIISWLPPRRPNGIVTKYNVYIRILDKGQELKILKEVLPSHNRYFEAKDLTARETYESWVTASTRVGQGPSTPVIKLIPSASVPAAIISFSQTLSVDWRVDMKLACVFVGTPKPNAEWKVINARSKKHFRLEVSTDNTLTLRNIQRSHEGNYSCMVRNAIGSDQIVYQLYVQVPPSAPILSIIGTTTNSVSLQWRVEDIGGATLRGFTLTFRKEFGDWEEIELDRRVNSHIIENLQCGTRYQFNIVTFNKIGTSSTSAIETAKTKGNKPIAPHKHNLIRSNITSAVLELSSWQDGGCPILYFSIEFKRSGMSSDWIIVSSRIETHTRYTIGDLEPGAPYHLRVTAHNNAGSTIKEYYFETLRFNGLPSDLEHNDLPEVRTLFRDAHLIAVIITSVFGTILALIGACICFKNYPRQLFSRNVNSMRPNGGSGGGGVGVGDNKDMQQHREQQYYEHENQSANIQLNRKAIQPNMYDPRSGDDNTLTSAGVKVKRSQSASSSAIAGGGPAGECSHTNTEKRHKRRSKTIKSESEEYDSLNSDSDLSGERGMRDESRSGRESSGHMDDPYNPHGHSPRGGPPGVAGNKERLSVFSRPQLHKNFMPIRKRESPKESSRTSNNPTASTSITPPNNTTTATSTTPTIPNALSIDVTPSAVKIKVRKHSTTRNFFHAIIPSKIMNSTSFSSSSSVSFSATATATATQSHMKAKPQHIPILKPFAQLNQYQMHILPSAAAAGPHLVTPPIKLPTRPLSPSPPYRYASASTTTSTTSSSSKHERQTPTTTCSNTTTTTITTTNTTTPPNQRLKSPTNALIIVKTSGGSGSGSSDSGGYHKRSLSSSSMDPVPFDYRLFDPPPKQHKQSSASPHQQQQQQQQQQYQQQQQRQASAAPSSSSSAQNTANHTNLPGCVSGKVRTKNSDSNANNSGGGGGSLNSNEFQCSPHIVGSIAAPHIAQSGSYVEILKQTHGGLGVSAVGPALPPTQYQPNNPKRSTASGLPSLVCHNKSYGDFLTITPRRKGKLLSTNYEGKHRGGDASGAEPQDNYRHHLPHSIEPLHLLGIPNDNMSTFFDYRAMETMSNADTLAIGSTMAGHNYVKGKGKSCYETSISSLNANNYAGGGSGGGGGVAIGSHHLTDEFQQILNEKNLSPPSAFSDNVSMGKA